jgi:hypothetical protein
MSVKDISLLCYLLRVHQLGTPFPRDLRIKILFSAMQATPKPIFHDLISLTEFCEEYEFGTLSDQAVSLSDDAFGLYWFRMSVGYQLC